MAKVSCSACEDLRTKAPNVVVNGLGTTECNYLKNNTGLSGKSTNCADLEDLNDCLIGNMESEIDTHDVCDWKKFMKKFVPNVWTTIKGIICSLCGLWSLAERIDCIVDYITKGASFDFGEYTSSGSSYIVAGKGVSFANVSASGTANDIEIAYVSGGMSSLQGTCLFYNADFTDKVAVANYDQSGVNPTTSASRKGNSRWETSGYLGAGGELVYELRIKKSEYPQISRFWNGLLGPGSGGAYEGQVIYFGAGRYAWGQRGWCDSSNGNPVGNDSDRGHLVPDGWMYLQVRLKNLEAFSATAEGGQYTPVCIVPMRINQDEIKC